MLKFISLVLVILVMMVFGSENLLAAEANDAEMHYFRGIEYYMQKQYYDATLEFGKAIRLKPNYTDAESAFKVAYVKLKENDSEEKYETKKTLSLYECLGGYQGAIFGFTAGFFIGNWEDADFLGDVNWLPSIGGTILGAGLGYYLGSRTDTWWEKGSLIGGAVIATYVGALMTWLYLYTSAGPT